MPTEPTRAIYVRMSDQLARKLDRAAERLGATKRDVLTTLVDEHLDIKGDTLVLRTGNARSRAEPDEIGEVLTPEETAEILRATVDDVRALIDAGELPARRVGDGWRLSRTAVLSWLRGAGT